MTIYKKKIYIIMLLGFSLLSVFWIISEKNSFCFDDTTWLLKVSTTSYQDLFSFIPHSAYLDRPIGVIFLKLLYDLFGLDYGYHHAVLIGLHIINTVLVFLVTQVLFEFKFRNNDKTFLGAVVTAGFLEFGRVLKWLYSGMRQYLTFWEYFWLFYPVGFIYNIKKRIDIRGKI